MFEVKSSRSGLIKVIREILDGDLSYLKQGNGLTSTMPSVIKYRASGNTPDYPYVTVNYDSVLKPQDAIVGKRYDTENNRMVYNSFVQVTVSIRCFGDDSVDILNKLDRMISLPTYLGKMRQEAQLSLQGRQRVADTPTLHATEWVDGATLLLTFYANDEFYDENGNDQFFDSIDSTGKVEEEDVSVSVQSQ